MAKQSKIKKSKKSKAVWSDQDQSDRIIGAKEKKGTASKSQTLTATKSPQKTLDKKPIQFSLEEPATTKKHSSALAKVVVTSITDRFMSEANKNAGILTLDNINNINKKIDQKMDALETVFEASFNQFLKTRDEDNASLFHRLVISRFIKLIKDGEISGQILPGFNMALEIILGQDLLDDYQGQCQKIMKKIDDSNEKKFELEKFYIDSDSNKVALDAQINIALYFEDFDNRADWFLKIINDNLELDQKKPDDNSTAPGLNKNNLLKFLDSILFDLKEAFSTEGGRLLITKNKGVDIIVKLADTFQKIEDVRVKIKKKTEQ